MMCWGSLAVTLHSLVEPQTLQQKQLQRKQMLREERMPSDVVA
mgnify:CR=1 FL=1